MGGVIGAGLFVGSGAGVRLAGPGIVISFIAAGVLAMLVMRMMSEMSAAIPSSGSFSEHVGRAFGPWAGFTIGWLYWTSAVVVLAVEATAAAIIVKGWLPDIPQWTLVLVFMTVFTAVNLAAVARFGEFEFWFALVKVVVIVLFLVIGVLAVVGWLPGSGAIGLSNLTSHGGFLPQGWNGVVAGLLAVLFAFGGLEVITIAAAESDNPAHAVGRAVRSAVWRIAFFYVGSMIVVVTVLPWNDVRIGQSPFVAVLDEIGIPAAVQIMNAVVLVALLSALNANMFSAARMIFSLARRGFAPGAVAHVNSRGVPAVAVVASAAFGFVAVVLNMVWPDTIFLYMLNAAGAVLLLVWIFVACAQLRLRKVLERTAPATLTVKMWGYPYLTLVALAAMVAILVLMLTDAASRTQLISSGVLTVVVLAIALVRTRHVRTQV